MIADTLERPAAAPGRAAAPGGSTPGQARPAGEEASPGAQLIRIEGEMRDCTDDDTLFAHLANDTLVLMQCAQVVVFARDDRGATRVRAASGVSSIGRDSPMVRWLERLGARAWRDGVVELDFDQVCDPQDACTGDFAHRALLWARLPDDGGRHAHAVLFCRTLPWEDRHRILAARLAGAYGHALAALRGRARPVPSWYRHRRRWLVGALAAALLLACVPVSLTTLAPVEVVPREPFVVAAQNTGVVDRLLVQPNSAVREGDALVQLVDATLRSDYEVADRKLEVAKAKVLRVQQAVVDDPRAKRELAIAQTERDVAQAEYDFARQMLERSVIRARRDGIALYSDPRDWVGRPVAVGEAIMRIADPRRVEFQLRVPVADAVNLDAGRRVKVYLDAAPLEPLETSLERAAYRAEPDAAGTLAFVATALADPAERTPRLGLRGIAQVYGERVALGYYLLRRPLIALRQWTGF